MVVAGALIVASVTAANGADVSAQATLGAPASVISTTLVSPTSVQASVVISANVGPKLQITLPTVVDFGNVNAGDTGSKAFDVIVKSTRNYTISRAYAASNPLGLVMSGALPGGVVASREATYTETAAINVGWATQGPQSVPVTYTVVW